MLTPDEWTALWLSLRVAGWSVALMSVPGVLLAWLLARTRFRGKVLLDALIHLPLVLPPVVVGYLLLLTLGRRSWIGRWLHDSFGIDIAFTWKAAALASAIMGFPLLVRSVRLAIDMVDIRLEQAAGTLGAGPLAVFWTITLPLSLPGLLVGMVLAFARGLGEFGATITFAGNIEGVSRTLPVAIYTSMQVPGGDTSAMRLVLVSISLSLGALLASELMARRIRRRIGLAEAEGPSRERSGWSHR